MLIWVLNIEDGMCTLYCASWVLLCTIYCTFWTTEFSVRISRVPLAGRSYRLICHCSISLVLRVLVFLPFHILQFWQSYTCRSSKLQIARRMIKTWIITAFWDIFAFDRCALRSLFQQPFLYVWIWYLEVHSSLKALFLFLGATLCFGWSLVYFC